MTVLRAGRVTDVATDRRIVRPGNGRRPRDEPEASCLAESRIVPSATAISDRLKPFPLEGLARKLRSTIIREDDPSFGRVYLLR